MFDSIRLNGVYYGPFNLNGPLNVDTTAPFGQIAHFGEFATDGPANIIDPANYDVAIALYPQFGFTGNSASNFYGVDLEVTISGIGNLTSNSYAMNSGLLHYGSGIVSNAFVQEINILNSGLGSIVNATGMNVLQLDGALNRGFAVANQAGVTGNTSFESSQNAGTGCFAFRGLGTAPSKMEGTMSATGYLVGTTAGIDASITSAGLVGKTITVVKGIITAFA